MTVGVDSLPAVVPVFAVPGALLLPGARLPLSVFEPRYLALTDHALGAGRLFALVQPRDGDGGTVPGLYDVGTLARIVAFGETDDGRYLITAQGVARFRLVREDQMDPAGFRRVAADYRPFAAVDFGGDSSRIDRRRLLNAVLTYLARQGVGSDLGKLDGGSDSDLVSALAMAAPLSAEEKQALLEADTAAERARMMIALFEMALLADDDGGGMSLH
ncbi:MAG: LON peptidase substrate-binding domain-containing protein [Solirubrobacterales bacterium]